MEGLKGKPLNKSECLLESVGSCEYFNSQTSFLSGIYFLQRFT